MAEELDGTQKPKVELIKHQKSPNTQPDQEQVKTPANVTGSGQAGVSAEHGERKKLLSLRKSPRQFLAVNPRMLLIIQ